jgi:hypothetical protein
MENILQDDLPEIVLGASSSTISRAISKAVKVNKLKKIGPRLYTSNLSDSPEVIVARNRYFILGKMFPGAVISFRTALEGAPTKDGEITFTYKYTKKIKLPGLTIRLFKGMGPIEGDTAFMENLFLASRARAFLENMQVSRRGDISSKVLATEEIESRLENICRIHGVDELNKLRDQARNIAKKLEMQKEFKKLDKVISAILGTHQLDQLHSSTAKARAKGVPYDRYRLELFADLAAALRAKVLPKRMSVNNNPHFLRNIAFFDAYFSNYIEGTEFEVDEAAEIVFEHKINLNRPEDSHDILATFRLLSNNHEMVTVPSLKTDFIDLLKKRHAILLEGRHKIKPGFFKEINNRAGQTVFVAPELVVGTLKKSFELYKTVEVGLARAIFMMFVVAEIHPFVDGNGRLARVMMNSELVFARENRIIIPTVFREDYLLALRSFSRGRNPNAYIDMLIYAQEFTSRINFSKYEIALEALKRGHAFMKPYEGRLLLP